MASGSDDCVVISKGTNGITTIALNRPQYRNAVNPSTATELYQAFLDFEADASQLICVFHGCHGTFCAGYDLQELARSAGRSSDHMAVGPVKERNQGPMGPSRLQIQKPVIAAVAGYAVAGGLELSLLADMRIVEEDAVFGVFCRRFGVPLIDGGTVRLPAIVGLGRAMDMILTGRAVGAHEALAMGLANRVVPKGQALTEALKLAEELVKFPQACMNVDRTNCYYNTYAATSLTDALAHEFEHGIQVTRVESIDGAKKFASGSGRHGDFKL